MREGLVSCTNGGEIGLQDDVQHFGACGAFAMLLIVSPPCLSACMYTWRLTMSSAVLALAKGNAAA